MSQAFTLIELLVTLTIVSILTAIAIPQYRQYRSRAFDLRAQSDLRNVAIAEETYFLDNEQYLACENNSCTNLPGIKRLSQGVELAVQLGSDSFVGNASHPRGTGKVFTWDSENGGFLE